MVNSSLFAQNKYWIFFQEKNLEISTENLVSKESIENRKLLNLPLIQETDYPINPEYLQILKNKFDVEKVVESRWLNGISAFLYENQIKKIQQLSFVKSIELIKSLKVAEYSNEENDIDLALESINAKAILDKGFTGKNVKIGIIDSGFENAKTDNFTKHLFTNNQIIITRDFVNPKSKDFFDLNETFLDFHGKRVLQSIAGKNQNGEQMGLATDAKFYLARTDHGINENRREEDYWIAAIEWMERLGVRLINSSLGYADQHDNPLEDYKTSEINGNTAKITKAATIAAKQKGMIIVVSAGNEGNRNWKIIVAPADSKEVLSVGATKENRTKANYSSIGTAQLNYLKPNVSAYSRTGTSFSAPIITGLIACILENNPTLTHREIFDFIEQSGHLFPYGNNYVGYGIPQSDVLLELLEVYKNDESLVYDSPYFAKKKYKFKIEKTDTKGKNLVLYHKTVNNIVLKEKKISYPKNPRKAIVIKKNGQAKRTTVSFGNKVFEIIWK